MFQSVQHFNEALDSAAMWIVLSTICLTVVGILLAFV